MNGCLGAESIEQALREIRKMGCLPNLVRQLDDKVEKGDICTPLTDAEKNAICVQALKVIGDFRGGAKLDVISSWLPRSLPNSRILEILCKHPDIRILEYAPREYFIHRR